jgi:hypothetical protein
LLIDLLREPPPGRLTADVVIVGAGAIGLTMAVALARRGREVLLLEAGGEAVTSQSQALFQAATSTGYPLIGLHEGRFRALGGTTTFWGGQLTPLDPLTYGHRPWVSDDSWPISHEDVAPYYERVFALLGMSRQIARDADVWERLQVPPPPQAENLQFLFTRWVPEADFSRLFGAEIRRLRNLTVLLNAPVTALQTDPAGQRIVHARVAAPGGQSLSVQAPAFVLANGTIESARLLLCPLADGASAPWSGNPWIGRGFMDHIEAISGAVDIIDPQRFHSIFDVVLLDHIKYQPKIKLSEGEQQRRQLFSIVGYFRFNSSLTEHLGNAKIFLRGAMRGRLDFRLLRQPGQLVTLLRSMAPMVRRYVRDRRVYSFADRGVELVLCSEQRSLASSGLRLRPERDALGMPLIALDWRIDGCELETFATFAQMLRDYLERNGLARIRIAETLLARDPAFLKTIHDTFHQMGTARMSSDPEHGVVDANLRVHGTGNLYVAGAAVYPTSGFQNSTFTALALGQRLVDTLA